MEERKEWVRVAHAGGKTSVTVTLQEDSLVVRWSVKTYIGLITDGVREARAGAERAMGALKAALSDMDAAA